MITVTREVPIEDVTDVRPIKSVETLEISGDSWAECFAAASVWLENRDCTLVGVDKWLSPDNDENPHCLYLFVDDTKV